MARRKNDERMSGTLLWAAAIHGQPYSKANRRQKTRDGRFIKSKEALAYEDSFHQQASFVRPNVKPYEGDVCLTATLYYRTRMPDLDVSLVMDCLQGHAYVNDRQVKEIHLFHGLDKAEPRAEIEVRAL